MRYFFASAIIVSLAACATPASTVSTAPSSQTSVAPDAASAANTGARRGVPAAGTGDERYVPHRVYDTRRSRFADLETMLADLARADVIFLGEQHDDPRTHRLQLAALEGLDRRREGPVVVSLEMFERDVQPALDAYLTGTITREAFLGTSRPWPNNATDYQPLVDYARTNGWPVLAANIPRRLASVVSRRGLVAIDSLPAADRALVAAQLSCPRDEYWRRFEETMGDMSGHGMQMTPDQAQAMVQRFYEAQCAKDETMAESIARAFERHRAPVIHANGAFHSDYRLGTASRVRRRLPGARIAVVSFVPVADLDRADGRSRRRLADWVVFTLETPKPAAARPDSTARP
jgi:uncharacterized iron-regulated protein